MLALGFIWMLAALWFLVRGRSVISGIGIAGPKSIPLWVMLWVILALFIVFLVGWVVPLGIGLWRIFKHE